MLITLKFWCFLILEIGHKIYYYFQGGVIESVPRYKYILNFDGLSFELHIKQVIKKAAVGFLF